ncbi:MAG TPA: MauE/DoxX family redox-associated membrane protein, partial [Longimicrobiaceae bacterium]|nr:MauE/DoxX family redox-associated membrane protein [Longimicrobiaceae bacterium]
MNAALRSALALLFTASAVAKAADFPATSAQLAQGLHLAEGTAAALVAALVMGEATLAGALLLAGRHQRAVAAATASVLAVFLAVAGWMQVQGVE